MTTLDDIKALITEQFGEEAVVATLENCTPGGFEVLPYRIAEIAEFLHTHEKTYFDYLSCLTGMDNGEKAGTFGVVYHLYSIPYHLSLTLKVTLPAPTEDDPMPTVPSVAHIWRTADWHEREAYDLLGIKFTGHPDMRRILLPADWEGHPLRKNYSTQEYYHGIKVDY